MDEEVIRKCLAPVLKDATFYKWSHIYSAIEVHFKSVDRASGLSDKSLRTENVVLLSMYMDKRTARVRIEAVPPRIYTAWIIAAFWHVRDDKMNVLNITKYTQHKFGKSNYWSIDSGASKYTRKSSRQVGDWQVKVLKVCVEGRKRCLKCAFKRHVRVRCGQKTEAMEMPPQQAPDYTGGKSP